MPPRNPYAEAQRIEALKIGSTMMPCAIAAQITFAFSAVAGAFASGCKSAAAKPQTSGASAREKGS